MWNHAWTNLLSHKLRLALTTVAVVLGIAFMCGTLVLTGTIKHSIDSLIHQATSGYSVVVRATTPYGHAGNLAGGPGAGGDQGVGNARPLTPASLLPVVRSTPAVAGADGSVTGQVALVDNNGKTISGHHGAPTIGFAWLSDPQISAFKLRTGQAPTGAGQMVVDANTAKKNGLGIGSRLTVIGVKGPEPFTVVGTIGFGSATSVAGDTVVGFAPPEAQSLFGKRGYFNQIEIAAKPGTNTDSLINAVAARLPKAYEAVSSATVAQEDASSVNSMIGTFNDLLLAFAFIALFVGAFLIFNTFSILVGQRTRELALLRALGASRGQVTRSVIFEAALTGLAGSVAGVVVGILLAAGLLAVLRSFLDLNSSRLIITAGGITASVVVGMLVTVVSALGPSFRASRVPPVAAMRDDAVIAESSLRRRAVIGGSLAVLGFALLLGALVAGSGVALVGLGAAVSFIGVAMLITFVAAPLARVIAAPLSRLMGVAGRLSTENAARNPRRTAATAATLMIGLALVAAVATLASSTTASFGAVFTSTVRADYVVTATNPFSRSAETVVAAVPGVTAISPFTEVQFHSGNAVHTMAAIDPTTGPELARIDMISGTVSALAAGEVLVDSNVAKNDHLTVGSPITMGFTATGAHTYRVGGTYKTNQLLDNYLTSIPVAAAATNELQDEVVLVDSAHPSMASQAALSRALDGYPQLSVKTASQFVAQEKKQTEGGLRFVYVLLALSILIALIGVINTLLLSVLERTHEIGLLRAVGMRRQQVRSMIRGEAVVVSVLGAILGLLVGVGLGAAIVRSLSRSGVSQLVVPWSTVVVVLILAILFGVFAAIFPARRAARLDILTAISTQ